MLVHGQAGPLDAVLDGRADARETRKVRRVHSPGLSATITVVVISRPVPGVSGFLPVTRASVVVPASGWGGKKLRIPLEDDAIITERGAEWLAPLNERMLLIT